MITSNLQKLRIWKGLSQGELAELANTSVNTIRMMEKHNFIPKYQTAVRIATVFDKTYQDLFNIVDDEEE